MFFLLALAGLAFVVQPGMAAPPGPTPPGGHLNITEVSVDLSNSLLFITGEDLDFGGDLTVTLGEFGELTTVGTPTATGIVANLPDPILAGDYLLTVSRGNGQSQNDEYDLTIGAVGPQGDPGSFTTYSNDCNNVVVCAATCQQPGERVVSGGCFIRFGGSVALQNTHPVGTTQWHCAYVGTVVAPTAIIICK